MDSTKLFYYWLIIFDVFCPEISNPMIHQRELLFGFRRGWHGWEWLLKMSYGCSGRRPWLAYEEQGWYYSKIRVSLCRNLLSCNKDFIKSRNCGVCTGVSEIPHYHFEQLPKKTSDTSNISKWALKRLLGRVSFKSMRDLIPPPHCTSNDHVAVKHRQGYSVRENQGADYGDW